MTTERQLIGVRLPTALIKKMRKVADAAALSMQAFVEQAIAAVLTPQKPKKKAKSKA